MTMANEEENTVNKLRIGPVVLWVVIVLLLGTSIAMWLRGNWIQSDFNSYKYNADVQMSANKKERERMQAEIEVLKIQIKKHERAYDSLLRLEPGIKKKYENIYNEIVNTPDSMQRYITEKLISAHDKL